MRKITLFLISLLFATVGFAQTDFESMPANKDSLRKIMGSTRIDAWEKKGFFEDFTYLKIFNQTVANNRAAIFISQKGKKKNCVEIYTINTAGVWDKKSKNTIGDFAIAQLDVVMKDYNFDGANDLYIQASMSNGIGLSYGYVLMQDKPTGKFAYNKRFDRLANAEPDNATKTVISDEYIDCPTENQYPSGSVCKLTHQWENGKLEQVKKDCPCKEENN